MQHDPHRYVILETSYLVKLHAIQRAVERHGCQSSAGGPLSSPVAAQRCAEGAGLDSGPPVAAQSAMPSLALPYGAPNAGDFAPRSPARGASSSVSNLHQLDERDPVCLSWLQKDGSMKPKKEESK